MDNGEDSLMFEKLFTITVNDLIEGGFNDGYSTNMKIYANPFNESASLRFSNTKGHSYNLFIRDLLGKVSLFDH